MMQTIELPGLAEHVRALPADGAGRDRQLQHLVDLYSAAEAAAALHTSAQRKREDSGVVSHALMSADSVVGARSRGTHDSAACDRLRDAVSSRDFLGLLPAWIGELREVASSRPDTGACALASAFELWAWTMKYFRAGEGARVEASSQAVDELAEAVAPLLAARALALEVAAAQAGAPAEVELRRNISHVHAARTAALAGAVCAELVFGYRRHLLWDEEGCDACYGGDRIDELEAVMPGIASGARASSDVVEADGSHPAKRGPCVRFDGVDTFMRLRTRLDGCLTGARIAKDRAAATIAGFMLATTLEGKA